MASSSRSRAACRPLASVLMGRVRRLALAPALLSGVAGYFVLSAAEGEWELGSCHSVAVGLGAAAILGALTAATAAVWLQARLLMPEGLPLIMADGAGRTGRALFVAAFATGLVAASPVLPPTIAAAIITGCPPTLALAAAGLMGLLIAAAAATGAASICINVRRWFRPAVYACIIFCVAWGLSYASQQSNYRWDRRKNGSQWRVGLDWSATLANVMDRTAVPAVKFLLATRFVAEMGDQDQATVKWMRARGLKPVVATDAVGPAVGLGLVTVFGLLVASTFPPALPDTRPPPPLVEERVRSKHRSTRRLPEGAAYQGRLERDLLDRGRLPCRDAIFAALAALVAAGIVFAAQSNSRWRLVESPAGLFLIPLTFVLAAATLTLAHRLPAEWVGREVKDQMTGVLFLSGVKPDEMIDAATAVARLRVLPVACLAVLSWVAVCSVQRFPGVWIWGPLNAAGFLLAVEILLRTSVAFAMGAGIEANGRLPGSRDRAVSAILSSAGEGAPGS